MSPWTNLLVAGFFEVIFAISLKLSAGLAANKLHFTAAAIIAGILSFILLARALNTFPVGVAYSIWTGIGVVGTTLIGFLVFKDAVSFQRLFFLLLLIIGLLGLRFTSAT